MLLVFFKVGFGAELEFKTCNSSAARRRFYIRRILFEDMCKVWTSLHQRGHSFSVNMHLIGLDPQGVVRHLFNGFTGENF